MELVAAAIAVGVRSALSVDKRVEPCARAELHGNAREGYVVTLTVARPAQYIEEV